MYNPGKTIRFTRLCQYTCRHTMNVHDYKNTGCIYTACFAIFRYAEMRIRELEANGKLTRRSRFAKWCPITLNELYGFLAIILNMGLIVLPELEDYWKTSWVSEVSFFARVMPRDWFELIFWLLHVETTLATIPTRRIDKVQALLNLLIPRFQASYNIGKHVAIDETMVEFRGRFSAKQYMPKKPTKWGIKAFTMADSSTGYMCNILLYMGAETLDTASTAHIHLPQPARVVMELMTPYLNNGHHLYTDRYYTSVQLAQELTRHGTAFTGVCNKNRIGLPDDIRHLQKLRGGEVQAFRSNELLALAWQAEKRKVPVIMLSTEATAEMVLVQSSNRHIAPTTKPAVVNAYNQNMNGVDVSDQLGVYYSFQRKTVKCGEKCFFGSWKSLSSTVL